MEFTILDWGSTAAACIFMSWTPVSMPPTRTLWAGLVRGCAALCVCFCFLGGQGFCILGKHCLVLLCLRPGSDSNTGAWLVGAGESVSTATGAVVASVESSSGCGPEDLDCMRAEIQGYSSNDVQVGCSCFACLPASLLRTLHPVLLCPPGSMPAQQPA